MAELLLESLTDRILQSAIAVHRGLGPGLLESAYELCLFDKMMRSGLRVQRQVEMPIEFEGHTIDCGYRIDLLVNNQVIVEIKSVNELAPVHSAQLLTCMRLATIPVGLLMNFNTKRLMDGTRRLVLSNPTTPSAISASSAVNPSTGD